jgi:hypothetical protein
LHLLARLCHCFLAFRRHARFMLFQTPRHPAVSRLHVLAQFLSVCSARSGPELLRSYRTGCQEDERAPARCCRASSGSYAQPSCLGQAFNSAFPLWPWRHKRPRHRGRSFCQHLGGRYEYRRKAATVSINRSRPADLEIGDVARHLPGVAR